MLVERQCCLLSVVLIAVEVNCIKCSFLLTFLDLDVVQNFPYRFASSAPSPFLNKHSKLETIEMSSERQ